MMPERKAMLSADAKALAKRSVFLHRTYKMLRDARNIPAGKFLQPGKVHAVYKVLPNTMLPMPRLFDAYDAVAAIDAEGLAGDVAECGVWNGGCVGLMALSHLKNAGPRRRFHLFDSFEGLPQPTSHDKEVVEDFNAENHSVSSDDGLVAIGACAGISQPAVERFLVEQLELPREQFIFHVGWFEETVPRAVTSIDKIALLRVDGDWYSSTKVCFDHLYDKVVPNGFIIIDDYGTFSGCRKAVDDFLNSRGIRPEIHHSDQDCIYFRKP